MKRNLLTDDRAGVNAMMRHQAMDDGIVPYPQHDPSHAHSHAHAAQENPLLSIWRRRWTVLSIMLCCGALAVAYLKVAPRYYTSSGGIIVEPARQSATASTPSMDGPGGETFLWQQVSLLQSDQVLTEAAQALLGPQATDKEIRAKVQEMGKMMSVDVGRKDQIITVSYDSTNAADAANCAEKIIKTFNTHEVNNRVSSKKDQADQLRLQKAKCEADLQKQRKEIMVFRKSNPNTVMLDPKGNPISVGKVSRLTDERMTVQLAKMEADANLATAEATKDKPAALLRFATSLKFTSPIQADYDATQTQLNAAELHLHVVQLHYGTALSNPQVIGETQFVDQLKVKLAALQQKFADDFFSSLELVVSQAGSHLLAIDKELDDARREAIEIDGVNADASNRNLEVDGTTRIIDQLDARIKDLEISADTDIPNVMIVQWPKVEERPSKPAPLRVLGMMLAVGLLLGGGFAIIRDKLDGRLRSAEEIAATLGLPVIGAIPHMKRGLTPLARSQAAHWDPLAEVAEAYRAVRTAIHFGVPADGARTIVVTSPAPGDGKSTLASNLAITMAQAGKRTLLLDADFRRPVQHKMFEVKEDSGLTSVLAGSETLNDAIHRTLVEGLDLLPAGPMPLNPSELLNGEAFADILEELSQKYDHIVLDGPPVMAVTDSRILAAVCDVTIMVLRAGKTTRKSAELARASLLSVGARLIGVAVNDVAKGEPQYGYYGDYSYQPVDSDRRRIVDEAQATRRSNSGRSQHQRLPSPVER